MEQRVLGQVRNPRGSILILTLFVLAAVFVLVGAILEQRTTEFQILSSQQAGLAALYTARAGLENGIREITEFGNAWEWGTPGSIGPAADHTLGTSAGHHWGTRLSGTITYPNNAAWSLFFIPQAAFPAAAVPSVKFWMWMSASAGDGGFLQFSVDRGITWTKVPTTQLSPAYNGTITGGAGGNPWATGTEAAYTGTGPAGCAPAPCWQQITWTPPSATVNGKVVWLAFRFGSDSTINGLPGWFIDDLGYFNGATALLSDSLESGPTNFAQQVQEFTGGSGNTYDALFWTPSGGAPTLRARGYYQALSANPKQKTIEATLGVSQILAPNNPKGNYSVRVVSVQEL